ncbi:hypothetical protein Nmel_011596 [Mimus melanotis]
MKPELNGMRMVKPEKIPETSQLVFIPLNLCPSQENRGLAAARDCTA